MPLVGMLKKKLEDYVFDDSWKSELRHLYYKSASQVTEEALKNTALAENDAAYVESFASSLGCEKSEETGDTIMGQMLTQVGVLGVTMGYGFFRMFCMKSAEFSACFLFYALDVLSVVMTVVALLPATLKFALAGRLVGRLDVFNDAATSLLVDAEQLQRLAKKAKLFVQEAELIQRGFTMVSAPVSRLDSGLRGAVARQCPDLRRTLFYVARRVTLDVRDVTCRLLSRQSRTGVDGVQPSHYVCSLPLSNYGSCLTVDESHREELAAASDDYCLDAIKSMVSLADVHISEFIRVLCLLCLVQANQQTTSTTGFVVELESIGFLSRRLTENRKTLDRAFVLHQHLESKMADIEAKDARRRARATTTPVRQLYLAVHSFWLHLLSAAKNTESSNKRLESLCESDEEIPLCDLRDLVTQMTSDLKTVGRDLSACKDCWEELDCQLRKLGAGTPADDIDREKTKDEPSETEISRFDSELLSVIPDSDPVHEDQVFEGYPDVVGEDVPTSEPLENDERCNRQEVLRVLTELKTVISVRSEEMRRREELALKKKMETETTTTMAPKGSTDSATMAPNDSTDSAMMAPYGSTDSATMAPNDSTDSATTAPNDSTDSATTAPNNSTDSATTTTTTNHPYETTNSKMSSDDYDDDARVRDVVKRSPGGASDVVEDRRSVDRRSHSGEIPCERDVATDVELTNCDGTGASVIVRSVLPPKNSAVENGSLTNVASNGGSDFVEKRTSGRYLGSSLTSDVARLAVEKSRQMAAMSVETFGDGSSESDASDDED